MIRAEGQKSWGWWIIIYIFLAGLGGGTFIFSFILLLMDKFASIALIGAVVGPAVVFVASILLLFDLGHPARAFRLFTTTKTLISSWMIRGAWILTAFIIFGLAYALPAYGAFSWLPWDQTSGLGIGIGIVAAILAIIVPVYPGLLLGVIKSIPLWNSAALPPLFFFSGLDTGIAVLGIAAIFNSKAMSVDDMHMLGFSGIGLIILLLITLLTYIEVVRQSGVTPAASVNLLKSFFFIVGVIVLGLLVPLGLLIIGVFQDNLQTLVVLEGVAAVLILFGGLMLRYTVVKNGVRMALN